MQVGRFLMYDSGFALKISTQNVRTYAGRKPCRVGDVGRLFSILTKKLMY